MESSTMIRDGDGGSPDAGGPTRESQAGYPTQASLDAESHPPRKARKRAIFGENKATMLFRSSNLTQNSRENKANLKSASLCQHFVFSLVGAVPGKQSQP